MAGKAPPLGEPAAPSLGPLAHLSVSGLVLDEGESALHGGAEHFIGWHLQADEAPVELLLPGDVQPWKSGDWKGWMDPMGP